MKQVLCFGDSNTWGLNPADKTRYPWNIRWTGLLQESFSDRDVRIIEDGIVGRTAAFDDFTRPYRNGIKELPRSLEANEGLDAVVLMLGTNDCKSAYHADAETITHGIETLLLQIRTCSPEISILLISPIHLGADVWKEEFDPEFDRISVNRSKELKEAYRMLAKKYKIDFLAASDYACPSELDMEHLTPEGHRTLAKAIRLRLNTIFAKTAVLAA